MSKLDEIILGAPPGTLLTPICAREVYVLRTIGTRWQHFVREVREAQAFASNHPTGFGDINTSVMVLRKYREDSVIGTLAQEIVLPPELFQWPL